MPDPKMQLADWLDDLCVRFLVNLPQEELMSMERMCFQIEEAQWFYEDFIRPLDPTLPQMNLAVFANRILRHCPLTTGYSDQEYAQVFDNFIAYKTRVPVRGAIMLDASMEHVLLVKGYKKNATWSFPRGKINHKEDDLVCAIREVWEETGYDIKKAGLVPEDHNVHSIQVTMREQHLRMFVFRNVPLDTPFEPQTRKEISKIQWYPLDTLPTYNTKRRPNHHSNDGPDANLITSNKLYMVAPFLPALRKWIHQQRKLDARQISHPQPSDLPQQPDIPHWQEEQPSDHQQQPTSDYQDIPHNSMLSPNYQNPHQAQHPASDPADELKRFLSLASAGQPHDLPSQHQPTPQAAPQADMLLAMLRAPSSALRPPHTNLLPTTPVEQIIPPPQDPQTPQAHHVKHSPHLTRQPPPGFPFSPNHQSVNQATHALEHLAFNTNSAANGAPPFNAQPQQHAHHTFQPQYPDFPRSAGPAPMPPFGDHFQTQVQAHAIPSLQPQGRGAIAHGPTAPKASQLPAPNMNSHTMSLLNAFKTPSQRHPQPAQVQSQSQHESSHYPQHFAVSQTQHGPNTGHPSYQQAPQSWVVDQASTNQMGPSRSNHQNSLLDLFRSPTAQKASPAGEEHAHNRAASLQTIDAAQPTQAPLPISSAEPAKQRSATMAMMTRTLPKAKASSPQKSTSRIGSVSGLFPAKQEAKRMQTATFSANLDPERQLQGAGGHDMSKTPVAILSRPGSKSSPASSYKVSPVPHEDVPSSPRRNRSNKTADSSKTTDSNVGLNFTILQRPGNRSSGSAKAERGGSPPPPQLEEASKSFQPQLLRRPKTGDTAAGLDLPLRQSVGSTPQNGSDQRDTLLALFAKSGPARSTPGDIAQARAGPPSSGSGSPLPPDPSAFRSRIASNASVVSNGDGMKSPSTPVEAKGFLLDYLNGVVKGEHHRVARRPQL